MSLPDPSQISQGGRYAATSDTDPGGSLEALTPFLNVANRADFVLVIAWLLAALRHGGPYPLLAVSGEQGSANTVFSKNSRVD